MPTPRKPAAAARMVDMPFALAALLTAGFYWFINQPAMEDTLLYRYTTQHAVEYVVVAFFIWGVTDVIFRALNFPREMLALRQEWLPPHVGREPVSHAAALAALVQEKPAWLRDSRMGQRLTQALAYLEEKGSADGFSDYLQQLADQDEERTHANYGLVRFIGWVTPVLGFLGTVLHFGTALSGLSVDEMANKLAVVVAEMGTAFNTTTGALTASTTMMFALFLCERTERGIIQGVDRRTERELLNRFVVADAALTPFLNALEAANGTTIEALDATVEHQLRIWSDAFHALQQQSDETQQRQARLWEETLVRLQQRFEAEDAQREKRLLRLLETVETQRTEHGLQVSTTVEQVSGLREDFAQLVQVLSGIVRGEGRLVELQSSLSENLRLLHETQKFDEAMHGLTAAIHLLTARHQPSPGRDHRAA